MKEDKMLKLESETWYYLYTDGKDIFISKDAPIKDNKTKQWWRPEGKYRCIARPIRFLEPQTSGNLQDFYQEGELASLNIKGGDVWCDGGT